MYVINFVVKKLKKKDTGKKNNSRQKRTFTGEAGRVVHPRGLCTWTGSRHTLITKDQQKGRHELNLGFQCAADGRDNDQLWNKEQSKGENIKLKDWQGTSLIREGEGFDGKKKTHRCSMDNKH